jgi:hypothetical protein
MSALDRAAKRWGRAGIEQGLPSQRGLLQSDHCLYGAPPSKSSEAARIYCESMASSMGTVTRVESNGLIWIDLGQGPPKEAS